MDDRKLRYMDYMREIEIAVKDGKVSRQYAEQKLVELRKKMFGEGDASTSRDDAGNNEMQERKTRYLGALKRVEAAMARGDLSKRDAEKKLIELRKQMIGAGEATPAGDANTDRDREAETIRHLEVLREIEAAVRDGKLSKEDARDKVLVIRAKIAADREDIESAKIDMERRFKEAVKKIQAAVESGDLSKAEAEKKLLEFRSKMSSRDK